MKKTEKDLYVLLEQEEGNVEEFASTLEEQLNEYKNQNLVVDLLDRKDLRPQEVLKFLSISDRHRQHRKSFVIINSSIDIDTVPEELLVVPTLREAEDLIQMEEIERELGF